MSFLPVAQCLVPVVRVFGDGSVVLGSLRGICLLFVCVSESMCVSDWHTMSDAVLMRAVNRRCDMHDDVAALQLCAPTHAMDAVACDVLKSLFQYVWNLSAPANAAAHRFTHKITTQSGRHEVDAARHLNHAHTRLFATLTRDCLR